MHGRPFTRPYLMADYNKIFAKLQTLGLIAKSKFSTRRSAAFERQFAIEAKSRAISSGRKEILYKRTISVRLCTITVAKSRLAHLFRGLHKKSHATRPTP